MEVAVHIHLLLGRDVGQDGVEHGFQFKLLLVVERGLQVAAQVPLGKDAQFAFHEGAVVLGQHVRFAGELELDQRFQCVGVHGRGVVVVEHLQVRGVAEVGHQHEAAFVVGGDDARHGNAGMDEHFVNLDKAEHVFALGRGVHHDQGGAQAGLVFRQNVDTEITAEAGVARRGACRGGIDDVEGGQPGGQRLQANIWR